LNTLAVTEAPQVVPTSVFLVGLPGSGKSTVGRQLARRLNRDFYDSDHVLEKNLGCSIREYFEQAGEQAFRDREEATIAELARLPGIVLSTGGGTPLRASNRQVLREHGWVVYLKSNPDDIFRRLRHDKTRPLLQVDDPLARLKELHRVRDPLYREAAHHIMETGRPSVASVVSHVAMQLEQQELSRQHV
jgi:shikimate kinase